MTTGVLTGISQGFTIKFPQPGKTYSSYTLSSQSTAYVTTTIASGASAGGTYPIVAGIPVAAYQYFRGLVCTDSGYIIGGSSGGQLQYSTDFGATWANLTQWFATGYAGVFTISMSADSTKMFIAGYRFSYLSTNGGSSWTLPNLAIGGSNSINACSLTGAEIIVWSENNELQLSLNAGTTWYHGWYGFNPYSLHTTSVSKDGSVFFMVPYKGDANLLLGETYLHYVTRTELQSSITSAWNGVSVGTNLDYPSGRNTLASNLTGSIVYVGCAYTGAVSGAPTSRITKVTGLPGTATVTTLIFDNVSLNQYCQNMECSSDGNTVVLVGGPNIIYSSTFYYISLNAGSTWTRYALPVTTYYSNCTCSPDGTNVYINGVSDVLYFIRVGYQGTVATFTTTTYTQTGLAATSSYSVTLTGTSVGGGGSTTLYTGTVTTL